MQLNLHTIQIRHKETRCILTRINSVVNQSGAGVLLFGDKTALAYASAFDRINVRRLFLTVEQSLQKQRKHNCLNSTIKSQELTS